MSKSIKLIREQKEEYMDHLFDLVYEPIYREYQTIYQDVCQSKEGLVKGILKTFQKEIANIPVWNQLKVDQFYQRFLEKTKCTYFEELLKTIYILSVKLVLLGLPQENRNKIQIKIPAPNNFLHSLLVHVARDVWKRPYLFYHQVKSVEQQNHLYQFEMIIRRKIRSVIRDTLPIDLMVQYMSSSELLKLQEDEEVNSSSEDESSEEEEETEPEENTDDTDSEPEEDKKDEASSTSEDSSQKEIETDKDADTESVIEEQPEYKQEPIMETTSIPDTTVLDIKPELEPEIEIKDISIVEQPEPETIYEEAPVVRKSLDIASSSDESIPVIREEAEASPSPKKLIHIQELIRHKRKSQSRPKNAFF